MAEYDCKRTASGALRGALRPVRCALPAGRPALRRSGALHVGMQRGDHERGDAPHEARVAVVLHLEELPVLEQLRRLLCTVAYSTRSARRGCATLCHTVLAIQDAPLPRAPPLATHAVQHSVVTPHVLTPQADFIYAHVHLYRYLH